MNVIQICIAGMAVPWTNELGAIKRCLIAGQQIDLAASVHLGAMVVLTSMLSAPSMLMTTKPGRDVSGRREGAQDSLSWLGAPRCWCEGCAVRRHWSEHKMASLEH